MGGYVKMGRLLCAKCFVTSFKAKNLVKPGSGPGTQFSEFGHFLPQVRENSAL